MIYDIDSVRWVIENYAVLSHGNWPDPKNDQSSGVRKPGVSHHAPFESPCIIAAEIARRVRVCGEDGLLVQLYSGMLIGEPIPAEKMVYNYRLASNTADIYRRINKVAWYCTDEEYSMGLTYQVWKHFKRYRRENVPVRQ